MAISATDLRRAMRFVYEANEASDGDAFSRPMLLELGKLIPADLVEYFEIRECDRIGLAYTTSRDLDDSPAVVEAFDRYRHQNPIGAFRWQPAHGALRLSAVISPQKLHRLELYTGYLRPARIRDQLKVWLWRTRDTAVCISLDRADGDFTERDRAILDVLQPHLAAYHAAKTRPVARGPIDPVLTRREAQVLTCAVSGRSNHEIAAMLFMSPGTVRKHLEHAYAKLGVHSRGEATAALMRIGPGG